MMELNGRIARMKTNERPDDDASPEGLTELDVLAFKADHFLEKHVDAGWSWDRAGNTRTHPADPEIHYRIDPTTQAIILSAKLVEQIRDELKRQRPGGER
jgi:hypothetical protein